MRLTELLNKDEVTISCELFPPKQGAQLENYKNIVKDMAALKPAYMSVTYGATGGTSDYTVKLAEEVRNNNIPALAHLTCASSTREKVASVIEELTGRVEERSPQTVSEYRAKLEARMSEVLANTQLDPARILTEAAIFADKVAVDEETVRLRSHIGQLRTMLDKGGAVGRKLDFLIQEFNREANTIGSKCSDIDIARHVVDIKAEIEKIREQIQNME